MGLSPEEIRGVSAGRRSREQTMFQMMNLLAGQKGREAAVASSEAATRLSEEKLRQSKIGDEDVIIAGPDGKNFTIKRRHLTESLKYVDQAKYRAKLGKLTDEQIKGLQEKISIKIKDASGKEEVFDVPTVQYSAISEAIREEQRAVKVAEAAKGLEGKSPEDMSKPENYSKLLLVNPGAATTILNRMTSDDVGLSDAHFRHYSKLYADYSTHAIKMGADDTLVETINGLGRKLRQNHMLLNVPSPTLWGVAGRAGFMKTTSVPLPPGVTIERIYTDAEELGVDVSDILQRIYERQQGK